MKRSILAVGLLGLWGLLLLAPAVDAWGGSGTGTPLSHWNCFRNHHNKFTTQITCKPYNAFTPICWGNMVCDGCCPSPCGMGGGGGSGYCMPMMMCAPPPCCHYGPVGMPCAGGACGPHAGACASDMPPMYSMPAPPMHSAPPPMMPDGRNPYVGPMPTPVGYPPMGYPRGTAQGMVPDVTQVNYQPNYYPNYPSPMSYYPPMPWHYPQQMPYYWYGYGR